MDRTKFFQKVYNTETSEDELDYLWSNFDKFVTTYVPGQYRLNMTDIMRPDLVSYKTYGTVDYWWLLCMYNLCMNPLTDMVTGAIWKVPNIADVYSFIKKHKVR